MISRTLHRQRGVAIITALLLTTLAITIVASLFWQQQVQVRSIENQRLQLQKQWILRGALDWAKLILRADLVTDQRTGKMYDHLDEPWAVPLADTRLDQYVENGRTDVDASDATLSGGIVDAQSRLNLKGLCVNGAPVPEEIAAFQRLLNALQLNPALADATASVMSAAQRKSATGQQGGQPQVVISNGAEPEPMDINDVDDLLAVPNFTPEILAKLKNFVIVLPQATSVNVNTAPPEVLYARIATLSLPEAASLVAARRNKPFLSANDVTSVLSGAKQNLPLTQISFNTKYFLINGVVRLNRAGMEMQALIERNSVTDIKVRWVRQN